MSKGLEKKWEQTQKKTFTKWCNMHLGKRGMKLEDIGSEFEDGIKLINLFEVIGTDSIGKYNKKPKMRIHHIENVNKALGYLKKKEVPIVLISAEDIVDGNLKLILGMIWTVILRFQIADISEEELSAKEALLLWCKKKTQPYKNVKVDNFTTSWADGLAFCALIHAHRPDLIPYDTLTSDDPARNLEIAFDVAEKELGIPRLLDIEDIVDVPKPDERSVMTYVAMYYHVFASSRKTEVAARRIGKLVEIKKTNEQLMEEYNLNAAKHVEWVKDATERLGERDFDNTLEGIKKKIEEFNEFKSTERPPKDAEKVSLESLNNSIALKLKNAGAPPFTPADGLTIDDINALWKALNEAQQARNDALLKELERQNKLDLLKRRFQQSANRNADWIAKQKAYLEEDDAVGSISEAQTKLMQLENFEKEYADSKPRIDAMNGLASEIAGENDKDTDAINGEAKTITDDWESLRGLADSKKGGLDDKLKDQEDKEALRKQFAQMAKDYKRWEKDAEGGVRDTTFGSTLEAVEEYKATLDANDAELTATNGEKKAALDALWAQLQEKGVTDNRYTVLTDKDVQSLHDQLQQALAQRQAAYADELERQRAMEAKRKEFAELAQAFIDHLDQRKSTISALEGEPAPLIEAIKSEYADGAPEKEKLTGLSALQDEMGKMGIADNRHTKYTIPLLDQHNAAFGRWVANRIAGLGVEAEGKNTYAERAQAVVDWINATQPRMAERDFDNTLEGARAKSEAWSVYKNTERAQQVIAKINTLELFEKTNAALQANGRPAFVAPEGLSPDDINAKWSGLESDEAGYEAAVSAELERQEKLAKLVKNFNADVSDLESFASEKEAYVDTVEEVPDLNTAHLKLMTHDVFDEEFKSSEKRIAQVKQYQSEIRELNYINADDIDGKVSGIDGRWASLSEKGASKRAALLSDQEREQKKEDLRQEFANKAREHSKWVKDTQETVSDTSFGVTLEAVTAFVSDLDASDSDISAANDAKKADLEDVDARLKEAGVTDNKYTTLTMDDVNEGHGCVSNALAQRREAYEAELARQQHLEAKRKEWADLAQQFMDSVTERQAAVDALEGEPETLIPAIKELYNDGAPENDRLSALSTLQSENSQIGITDNRHTEYTIPLLTSRSQQFAKHVRNLISMLSNEQEAKQEHRDRSAALVSWIDGVSHDAEFDNTLEGIRSKTSDFRAWKTTEKAQRGIEKLNLQTLFDKINDTAKENSRPAFAGEPSPADVDAKWEGLEGAVRDHEAKLAEESARQEKLFGLARTFNANAEELEAWADTEEKYLSATEDVPTLDDARLKLTTLGSFDSEFAKSAERVDAERALKDEIIGLNYHKGDEVNARMEGLDARWNKLAELAAAKRAALEADQQREQGKEDLRIEYADKTSGYSKWVKETVDSVGDYSFGLNLADVTAYSSTLDESDASIGGENDEKKGAIDAVSASLKEAGVSDNRHTSHTDDDVAAWHGQVSDALAKRREAYDAELARQQEDDSGRKDFAASAQEFVDWIGAQRGELEAVEGSTAERIEKVKAIYQDGAPARAKLDDLQEKNSALQARGVFSNEYTPHTTQSLELLNKQHSDVVANLLAAVAEEQEMEERAAAQEAEMKKKEEVTERRLDFEKRAKDLQGWCDGAIDVLTDPINADSPDQVSALQEQLKATESEREGKTPEYDALTALESELNGSGEEVSLAATTEKWDGVGEAIAARRDALGSEMSKQTDNEALSKEFSEKAGALDNWIKDETKKLAEVSTGDLESQLPAVQERQAGLASGSEQLADLAAVSSKMDAAGITNNKFTELTLPNLQAQFEQLESAVASQIDLLQKELLANQESQASPEQIDEFKEVFRHFDKEGKGTLRDFEFKSCLQSLGEECSDERLAKLMEEMGNADRLIEFNKFVDFMITLASDNMSRNEIAESFREVAGDKDFVTEEDLRRCMDGAQVDYLIANMPKYEAVEGGFDYMAWADSSFAQ